MPASPAADPAQGQTAIPRAADPVRAPRLAAAAAASGDLPQAPPQSSRNLELTGCPDDQCPSQAVPQCRSHCGRRMSAAPEWSQARRSLESGYRRREVRASWRCSRPASWART